jgi:UDP-GlcNAc:undecaprenyl-phosphate/decaprenyl-phosphate GlcNAc-1-phosphate transferase
MTEILYSILTAFFITFFAIPSIIRIALEKKLYDEPGERHSHTQIIPTLGGIGIFAGIIFSFTFWLPFDHYNPAETDIKYVLSSYIIIFLIGAKDDIIPLPAYKKFIGQFVAAFILVKYGNVRLNSLYGIFGISEIPELFAIGISVFTIVVIINAFNLIDGINGLAATIGIISCIIFGYWFYEEERMDMAIIAASTIGSLLAFLYYNAKNKIFMGDTGSLLIGITAAILAINFIESNHHVHDGWVIKSVPAVAIAILIIPLFDTLRVFIIRAIKGKSPFDADKNHIHHLLLSLNFSHLESTIILAIVNIVFVILAYNLMFLGTMYLIFLVFGLASVITGLLFLRVNAKKQI